MSNYIIYLKPTKCLTMHDEVINLYEFEAHDVDHVEIDGMFVRFRRDIPNTAGLWKDTVDVAVYNRDAIMGWEIMDDADEQGKKKR